MVDYPQVDRKQAFVTLRTIPWAPISDELHSILFDRKQMSRRNLRDLLEQTRLFLLPLKDRPNDVRINGELSQNLKD